MRNTEEFPTLLDSLKALCTVIGTESAEHIKPVHKYCSNRLVIEGGFPPEMVLPTPPLSSKGLTNRRYRLRSAPDSANDAERRVLGGIEYKNLDVTVVLPDLGPAVGISAKSTGNAFRNLTNRMEEAVGECANVHMMYPGFVFGFLHLIKFAKVSGGVARPDASFGEDNEPLAQIQRYHEVLMSLSGREAVTETGTRYESVGLLVYRCLGGNVEIWPEYPKQESPVHFRHFFNRLYQRYDLRFSFPDDRRANARKEWVTGDENLIATRDTEIGFPWSLRLAAT